MIEEETELVAATRKYTPKHVIVDDLRQEERWVSGFWLLASIEKKESELRLLRVGKEE